MRNAQRTFRKRSSKPLSKNQLRQHNEELFEAQLAKQKWFIDYIANLSNGNI